MVVPLAANAVWPVEKVVTVIKSGFCILIHGDDDGLDVLVAPTLQGRVTLGLRQRFYPRRVVCFFVVARLDYHLRPPRTRALHFGSSALRRSRSAQSPSILSSIR